VPATEATQDQRPPFGGIGPESKTPGIVTVWPCASRLIHVTTVPIGTETVPGLKLLLAWSPSMLTTICPSTGPGLWQATQAMATVARSAAKVAPRVKCSMKSASCVLAPFPPAPVLRLAIVMLLNALCSASSLGAPAGMPLTVRYPSEGAEIPAVSSSFAFGSAPPGTAVVVNGIAATSVRSGGWIAYVPFRPGRFVLHVRALVNGSPAAVDRTVYVSDGAASAFPSDVTIAQPGETLTLGVHAPGAARVTASGPGFVDVDLGPAADQRTGNFSAAIVAGVQPAGPAPVAYTAFLRDGARSTTASKATLEIASRPVLFVAHVVPYAPDAASGVRPYGMLAPTVDAPTDFTVPVGTPFAVTGRRGDQVRVALGRVAAAWIDRRELTPDMVAAQPPFATERGMECRDAPRETACLIHLSSRLPFRIYEGDGGMSVRLYGSSAGDQVSIPLALHQKTLWGYRVRWVRDDLEIVVRKPPAFASAPRAALRGLLIVVDPGHSPDTGAIGPLGTIERDVNVDIARRLAAKLRTIGARVVMTREAQEAVALYDRPALAERLRADVLISVHNNALPDGMNPSKFHGYSVYYFQPHSLALAQALHAAYARDTDLPDDGLHTGDLALVRTSAMPAALTESAFIMWPPEELLLRESGYRDHLAATMADGLERWAEKMRRIETGQP
jgi:N-acetylmuramoyl-L-alanine amidase